MRQSRSHRRVCSTVGLVSLLSVFFSLSCGDSATDVNTVTSITLTPPMDTLDALGAVESDEVALSVVDSNSSCLIRQPGSDDCKFVVMPMRL